MNKINILIVSLILTISSICFGFTPPQPSGAVTDITGTIGTDDDLELEQKIEKFKQSSKNEIGILVINSIGDESIEDIAYDTFNSWKIGQSGLDNGVLLVVAKQSRKMRIEVGKGNEGLLTDSDSKRIIINRIAPNFKEGNFVAGLNAGIDGIIEKLSTTQEPIQQATSNSNQPDDNSIVPLIIILAIILTIFFIIYIVNKKENAYYSSSSSSYGGGYYSYPTYSNSGNSTSSYGSKKSSSNSSSYDSSSSSSSDWGGFGGGSSGGGGASGDW